MKKPFLLFAALFSLALICSTSSVKAQGAEYTTAVGLRLGSPISASGKYFFAENLAAEANIGFRGYSTYSWVTLSAAIQKYAPLEIEGIEGLQWYFGGGIGLYFWNFDFVSEFNTTTFGVQGYLGLDYTFQGTPISITADWIPTIFLGDGFTTGFGAGFGALGVRYILN